MRCELTTTHPESCSQAARTQASEWRSYGRSIRTPSRCSCDDSTNEQFELLVEPDANPIDVYEHPYAYAAWRGIDYRTPDMRRAA